MTEQAAYHTLTSMGLSVVEIGEDRNLPRVPWHQREISLFGTQIGLSEQAQLAEELSTALSVRLPEIEAVRILAESDHRANTRYRLQRVEKQMADGTSLADAFEQSGPKVSPVFIALLRMGRETNSLPEQLKDLSVMLRRQDRAKSQVITALIYPAILVLSAVVVVLIVSLTLAPALMPLFEAQKTEPPASVSFFLGVGAAISEFWPWILAGSICLFLATTVFFKSTWNSLVFRLPAIGAVARDSALLTLLRSLAMLLKSGMPLADALRSAAEFDPSAAFSRTAFAAAASLERGDRAFAVIAEDPHVHTTVRELFRVGEEANALVPVLETLAASQADRLERRSQRLLRILTPILTLLIGLIIGGLVYSIMDAVFSINSLDT